MRLKYGNTKCTIKTCETCGKEYILNSKYSKKQIKSSKYCSNYCKISRQRDYKIYKSICEYCKKEYILNKKFSKKQRKRSKFCSNRCSGLSRIKPKKPLLTSRERSQNIKAGMNTPEIKAKLKLLNSRKRKPMTLERKIAKSNQLVGKMPKNLKYTGRFGNVHRGTYDINGKKIFFRSKWEANYALYLDFLKSRKKIIDWEFEPKTFIFDAIQLGTRSYTPDFKVITNRNKIEWHEVKGYMDAKSKTKLNRFTKYFPKEKLVLIDKDVYKALEKWSKLLNWY